MLHRIAFPVVSEWCQSFVQSKQDPKRLLESSADVLHLMGDSLELDGGPLGADHQHAPSLPELDGLIVDIHPDDRLSAHLLCLCYHLLDRRISCLPQ